MSRCGFPSSSEMEYATVISQEYPHHHEKTRTRSLGESMKRRRRSPLLWILLLVLACALELFVLETTFRSDKPTLGRSVFAMLGSTGEPANASPQKMYVWKDASGVTHISETPPPDSARKARELSLTPAPQQPAPSPALPSVLPVAPMPQMDPPKTPSEQPQIDEALLQKLRIERSRLEKQLYRSRTKGDGYGQIRTRKLLEENRNALEQLLPQGLEDAIRQ